MKKLMIVLSLGFVIGCGGGSGGSEKATPTSPQNNPKEEQKVVTPTKGKASLYRDSQYGEFKNGEKKILACDG